MEDVLFMRDEMANLAWAIERNIESPIEQPTPRADASTPTQDSAPDNKIISRLKRGAVLQPDGSQKVHQAWAWVAHRKQVGRGEGSSGLRFDSIHESTPVSPT